MKRALLVLAALLVSSSGARAQTLEDIRDDFSEGLRSVHFAKAYTGLVLVSDELELSGARYRFDDGADTEMSAIALPFHKTFRPWGAERTGVYVEGVVGYARATSRVEDLYSGAAPGLETTVDTEWRTWGGLVGVGPEFRIADGLSLATILNLGLTRLENRADYSGPGADLSAALADGLAFNWNALAFSRGGAARVDWKRALGEHHELAVVSRYDLRWITSLDEDDPAQEFSSRNQLVTLRADVTGPTGLKLWRRDLGWRATTSYRHFLEGDLFDARNVASVGGALELDVEGVLPFGSQVSLSGALLAGDQVEGWSLGVGLQL